MASTHRTVDSVRETVDAAVDSTLASTADFFRRPCGERHRSRPAATRQQAAHQRAVPAPRSP
ncbi:MAG: hypothetical protein M3467_01260, partial [Actinomycetota bacterium]|nr:hypothetical protein [Actinomycetota bacterium]